MKSKTTSQWLNVPPTKFYETAPGASQAFSGEVTVVAVKLETYQHGGSFVTGVVVLYESGFFTCDGDEYDYDFAVCFQPKKPTKKEIQETLKIMKHNEEITKNLTEKASKKKSKKK